MGRFAIQQSAVNFSDMYTNLVTEAIALLLWNGVLRTWFSFDLFPLLSLEFTATIDHMFWPVNFVFGISLFLHAYMIIKGYWSRASLNIELALNLGLIAIIVYALANPPFVMSSQTDETISVIWVQRSLVITAIVILGICISDCWKYYRMWRDMGTLQPANS